MTLNKRLRLALILAGCAIVVGLWMRAQPLWLDEEMIALNVRDRALLDLALPLWLEQSAPPGWMLLERLAMRVLGTAERAVRFVPMLFGVGTIAVAGWIARRWLNAAGGVTLLCLVGASPWLIYHATEAKPYSADAFWGLALPALAAWVIEAPPSTSRRRRAVWWAAAIVGLWCSNGAMLAVPFSALVLVVVAMRREGWPGAMRVVVPGLPWLVSAAVLYAVWIAPTRESQFLQGYWAFAMPPPEAGLWERATWIGARLPGTALKPGGSSFGVWFWAVALCGIAASRHRALAAAVAGVPAMAMVLGASGLLPFFERLVLWAMPAMYVGISMLVDRATQVLASTPRRLSLTGVLASVGIAAGALVTADIGAASVGAVRDTVATLDNHQLDDRAAVEWLVAQQRPGDVFVTTPLALPALWWYGDVVLTNAIDSGSRGPGGSAILEMRHTVERPACVQNHLAHALAQHERLLVLLGFRFDDMPRDFDDQLLEGLTRVGQIAAMRAFGSGSRAIVVERLPAGESAVGRGSGRDFDGCLTLGPARRW